MITLFHGSPNKVVTPQFGLGKDKHDYGRGFYLTADIELAKEWAVCRPDESNGWVHEYELDTDGLTVLDFQDHDVLVWLAELMKHRDADDSKRYRVLSKKFIASMASTPVARMSSRDGGPTLRIFTLRRNSCATMWMWTSSKSCSP